MDKIQSLKDAVATDWQSLSKRQSVLTAMLAIGILVALISHGIEGIGWALVAAFVIVVALMFTYTVGKPHWASCMVGILCGALVAFALPNFINIKSHGPDIEVIKGLHAIKLAIDRYAHDEGKYPADLEILRDEGYMPIFPHNDYVYLTKLTEPGKLSMEERKLAGEMKNISAAEDVSFDGMWGNFTYLPHTKLDPTGVPVTTSYRLLGFAKLRVDGIDCVIVNCMLDDSDNQAVIYNLPH